VSVEEAGQDCQIGRKLGLDSPGTYKIEVQGTLAEHWSDWLDGMAIEPQVSADGTRFTRLTGTVVDQAALHGLLRRLYDLGLPLLLVKCTALDQKEEAERW